jgi:hypothetical protein
MRGPTHNQPSTRLLPKTQQAINLGRASPLVPAPGPTIGC